MIFNRKALSAMSVASVVLPLALSGSVYAAAATKPKAAVKPAATAPMVSFSVSGNVGMALRSAHNGNAETISALNAAASSADDLLEVGMPGDGANVVFKGCSKSGQIMSGGMVKINLMSGLSSNGNLILAGKGFNTIPSNKLTSAEPSSWINPVNFEQASIYVGTNSIGTIKAGKFYALGHDTFTSSLGSSYLNGVTDVATIPFAQKADGLYPSSVIVTPVNSFAIGAQQGNAPKVAYESPEFYKGLKFGLSYVPQVHSGEYYAVNHGSLAVATDYMGKFAGVDVKAAISYADRVVQNAVSSAPLNDVDDRIGNEIVASLAFATSGFDGGLAYSKFNFDNKGATNVHFVNADAWRVNVGYTTDMMPLGKTSFGAEYSNVKNAYQLEGASAAGNSSDAKVYEISATHHMSNTQSFLKYVHADAKTKVTTGTEVEYKPISAIVLGTNYSF